MSEEIILLLQRAAIDEIPWEENRRKWGCNKVLF
jgi:hypothetical protein